MRLDSLWGCHIFMVFNYLHPRTMLMNTVVPFFTRLFDPSHKFIKKANKYCLRFNFSRHSSALFTEKFAILRSSAIVLCLIRLMDHKWAEVQENDRNITQLSINVGVYVNLLQLTGRSLHLSYRI